LNHKGGRLLRNCPVGNFKEEPDCRGGKMLSNTKEKQVIRYLLGQPLNL
jgi:hypothetical protein